MTKDKQQELILQQGSEIAQVDTSPKRLTPIEEVKASINRMQEIKAVVFKTTKRMMFDNYAGEYCRVNVHGAEYFAQMTGTSISTLPPIRHELDSGHYGYTVMVEAERDGRRWQYPGECNSRDGFFGTNNDSWKKHDKGWGRKLEEVDETQIRRKATANGIVNAVTRLLQMRIIPTEEFAETTGFDPPKAIHYSSRGKKEELRSAKGNGGNGKEKPAENSIHKESFDDMLMLFVEESAKIQHEKGVNCYEKYFSKIKDGSDSIPKWNYSEGRYRWLKGAIEKMRADFNI